MIHLKKVRNK